MKKKAHRRHVVHHAAHHVRSTRISRGNQNYLVLVRGWMFVVLFALMLGIGAVVGNFINQQLDAVPQVAGSQISR